MRIGIDIEPITADKAGIGFFVQNLIEALGKIDHQNSYLLYCREIPPLNLPPNFKFRVVSIPEPFWQPAVGLQTIFDRLDIYHSTHSFQIPAFRVGAGYRMVLTVHDLASFKHPEWFTTKVRTLGKLLPMGVKRSDKILVPTQSIKDELEKAININPDKISVTPYGVSDNFKPGSRKGDYILFVGTLEPRKNILNALRAFARLQDQKIIFKIAGKKGWYYQEIFDEVNRLGLKDRVEFLGYVSEEEKISLMQEAKVFVFPSWYEGFGFPALEAMACGTPVVTSTGGSLQEITGSAAMHTDPGDPSQMAEAIDKLMQDPVLYQRLRQAGIKKSGEYSLEKTARLTLKAYEAS